MAHEQETPAQKNATTTVNNTAKLNNSGSVTSVKLSSHIRRHFKNFKNENMKCSYQNQMEHSFDRAEIL